MALGLKAMRLGLVAPWTREGRATRRGLALLCAGAAFACGCATPPVVCDRPGTPEPVAYTGGTVEDGVYMSADWDGELLHFPGGAYFDLRHGLGERPRWWMVYLSFERDGLASGSVAAAAGNQAEVKSVNDESITLLNGSCADYWMLAVAGVD